MEKHFTASVYILKEDQILLLMHPKLKKWLPPGGHIEPNETPIEAAKREVKEETGLDIAFILDEHVEIDHFNAKSFPRPFLCLLEEIPAHGKNPAHQHIDLLYLAEPLEGSILKPLDDHPLKWFAFDEVQNLSPDEEIFAETQQVIAAIREKFACLS